MRSWGKNSKIHYDTLDKRLQRVLDRVLIEVADISITCGHRGQKAQNEAYYGRPQRSKLPWPKGKHNRLPSTAVDIQPYPMPREHQKLVMALSYIAGRLVQIGFEEGLTIRWGGDWDRDGSVLDQNFDDLFHFEIVETDNVESEDRSGPDIADTRLSRD